MKKSTPEEISDKWIQEMQEAEMNPNQMLECLALAKEKYQKLIEEEKINGFKNIHRLAKGQVIDGKKIKSINEVDGMIIISVSEAGKFNKK